MTEFLAPILGAVAFGVAVVGFGWWREILSAVLGWLEVPSELDVHAAARRNGGES